jgi:acyl-coenzyme A thioesterase PaaI-like protein
VIQEHFNDLVVGTYGRGFWILDDLSPLQQLDGSVLESRAHLFEPRDAYRFREITRPATPYDDPTTGENPEYGATINYWLSAPADAQPTVTIEDAAGTVVRTLPGTNRAGVNRIHWDLADESNEGVDLLTGYLYAPHLEVGLEGRPAPGAPRISILMPPGQYTVKLAVDGREFTQPLTVLKDPNSAGTEADIAAQVAFLKAVREGAVEAGSSVERVEAIRVQLQTLARFSEDESVVAAAEELGQKFQDLQMNMVDLRQTGQGQDGVRFEARLLQKFGYLTGGVSIADFRPTDQDLEVHEILQGQLREHLQKLDALVAGELADFNSLLQQRGVPAIGGGVF